MYGALRDAPPPYESVMDQVAGVPMADLFVPNRYRAPTGGRNSISYAPLPPVFDTTRIFLIDNKSADIASLNYQNDHSNFQTTIVQNSDYTSMEAANQTINLDERSRWGGDLKTILHTNVPNISGYLFSNTFKIKVPSRVNDQSIPIEWQWFEVALPEGNFSDIMVIDLMNNAVMDNYLTHGRQKGVKEEDVGVKFDTRNMRLGFDPETKLVMPGKYTHVAFHPDIILAPGCAVDFTHTRLNNLLGIRKRFPYQEGFVIDYDSLRGGNIPALLNADKYDEKNPSETIEILTKDSEGRSYHVGEGKDTAETDTWYRSWYLAYNYGPKDGAFSETLLVDPDVTCGVEQIYWSLPDMAEEPVTFRTGNNPSNYPVVSTELLPIVPRAFYNGQSVYSQKLQDGAMGTYVFDRLPEHAIMRRPPAPSIMSISENVPAITNHGVVPLRNSLSGVQRVTVTDARRRVCPYVYKSLGVVTPRVLSSRTL